MSKNTDANDDIVKNFSKEDGKTPVDDGCDLFLLAQELNGFDPTPTEEQVKAHQKRVVEKCYTSWSDVIGNTLAKKILKAFVLSDQPNKHALLYGPNRSGKTTLMHFALKAKFCMKRQSDLNPCGNCRSCLDWDRGPEYRQGERWDVNKNVYQYVEVDGNNPETFESVKLCGYRQSNAILVAYVDEVSAPEFVKFSPRLLKPMMERRICILASGMRIRPRRDPVTKLRQQGLSKDFCFRFTAICKTSAPATQETARWLREQCKQFGVEATDTALEMVVKRSGNIPGQALRPVRFAKLLNEPLTPELLNDFKWEPD